MEKEHTAIIPLSQARGVWASSPLLMSGAMVFINLLKCLKVNSVGRLLGDL